MTAQNKTHQVPFFRKGISMIAASACTKIIFCENVTYLVFAFSASNSSQAATAINGTEPSWELQILL